MASYNHCMIIEEIQVPENNILHVIVVAVSLSDTMQFRPILALSRNPHFQNCDFVRNPNKCGQKSVGELTHRQPK